MSSPKFFSICLVLFLVMLTSSCAPIKTLDVWKDEAYMKPLKKVLVIVLAQEKSVREQFENILANELSDRGVEVFRSYKVLPDSETKPDRETVVAKVHKLGVESVLVARSISKKEITNHQYGGVVLGGAAVYSGGGWYGYSYGRTYDKEYDTDYFTVSNKLYDVNTEKPAWSYISQVRVSGSAQGVVTVFVPAIIEQLEISGLVKTMPKS